MTAFDARRALDFAASISRPRLCGTDEERKVAGEVRKALEGAGWPVEEQFFEFKPVADGLLRVSLLMAHLGLAAVLVGTWKDHRIAYAGLAWLAALAVVIPLMVRRTFRSSVRSVRPKLLPGWILSSNLVARTDGPADGPFFVFMAHYDSKSQSLSLGGRISVFRWCRTAAFGFLGAALASLASAGAFGEALRGFFSERVPVEIPAAIGILVLGLSLPLYTLRTHNRSPGAMDNASGVGALVELARIWKSLGASKRSRAVFVAVSGEEFGMTGSQHWVTENLESLKREKRLRVLNFDGVGYTGGVWVVPARGPEWGGVSMSEAVIAAGKAVGVPVGTFPPSLGLLTDHASFTRERLPCASIVTHTWMARRLHTPEDTAETLKLEGFEKVGKVALRVIEDLSRGD